ncbi:bacteriophage V tail protein [Escherichia coli M056]|uniref:YmfQ family protein n=1 Tax=Escherichia coli TaxID=562 RepID=UPI000A186429|nr:putative phage tail protein [Escherichia coli]OSK25413.1 bacteriophage V tail protein [Escherichia coli M056]
MTVSEDEYLNLLYRLLPPGPAWEGDNPVLAGLAPSLSRVHQRAGELMAEIDPANTTELINRYEKIYGLPDSCAPPGVQTLQQRRQRLNAKANLVGGINEQFYRDQLDALGYPSVTIDQFQNLDSSPEPEWGAYWRYYWRVNIPADAGITWQTCTSACDSAIRVWGDTVAECVINKLAPSHTVIVFAYPEEEQDAQN